MDKALIAAAELTVMWFHKNNISVGLGWVQSQGLQSSAWPP